MKLSLSILLGILIHGLPFAQSQEGFVVKKTAGKYELTVVSKIAYYGAEEAQVDYFAGHYSNNDYQLVLSQTPSALLKVEKFGEVDSCVHFEGLLGKKTEAGKKINAVEKYLMEVFDLVINFEMIDSIYSYDRQDANYKAFTKSDKPFIDLENVYLKKLADSIWQSSSDYLAYAKSCYEFVAAHFDYGDPLTGFHSLKKILENGGGDCGNLCTVWINLLRIKGIPARHVVGNRPDESLHVWAEFYLENYGWIPVDVTYKQSDPNGDYFGKIKFENNGFVIHRGIGQTVKKSSGLARVASLQTYSYDVVYSKPSTSEVVVKRGMTVKMR